MKKSLLNNWTSYNWTCTKQIFGKRDSCLPNEGLYFLSHLSWKLKELFWLPSCHPSSVCPSVCLSVNFSHSQIFLQIYWANFNQTWHPWVKIFQVCLNEEPCFFQGGDNNKIAKTHWLWKSSPEPQGQYQTNLWQSILVPWWHLPSAQLHLPSIFFSLILELLHSSHTIN